MKQTARRIWVLLLSLAMVLTMTPTELTAAADESSSGETEAVQTVNESQSSASDINTVSVSSSATNQTGTAGTRTFTKEGDYTVTAVYGADAQLPENVELKVTEITDREKVASYTDKANEAISDSTVIAARYFDISFISDGQEIEPNENAKVDIKISFNESLPVSDGDNVQAVHYTEKTGNDDPEVISVDTKEDSAGNVEEVNFQQNSFSVTGVIVSGTSGSWPGNGEHALILNDGNDNYYAVSHSGSLLSVTVDGSNVTFDNVDNIDDYLWTFTASDTSGFYETVSYTDSTGTTYYLDLSTSNCIGTNSRRLYLNKSGKVLMLASEAGGSSALSYNLTINSSSTAISSGNYSSSNTVTASFADISDSGDTGSGDSGSGDSGSGSTGGSTDAPAVDLSAKAKKTLVSNNNGTYNLTLSVTGKTSETTSSTDADIIVVLDESNSMFGYEYYNEYTGKMETVGSADRMPAAKNALNTMTDQLLPADNNGAVRMHLIRFESVAYNDTSNGWVTSASTFKSIYSGDTISTVGDDPAVTGATNWEDALQTAKEVADADTRDVQKIIIFITDGNPTKSNSTSSLDGHENQSNYDQACIDAEDEAKALVDAGYTLYTVGIYDDVNKLTPLTKYAYSGSVDGSYPSGRLQTAADETSLQQAFTNIVNDITQNFGLTHVKITDTLTSMTNAYTTDADGNYTTVENGGTVKFTYTITKKDSSGNDVNVDVTAVDGEDNLYQYEYTDSSGNTTTKQFKGAVYDSSTGEITWDMDVDSDTPFILDDDYTYSVTLTVFPDQEAYDLITDLNNGVITESDLNDTQLAQLSKDADGNYVYLEANPDTGTDGSPKVQYNKVTTTTDSDGNTTTTIDDNPTTEDIENPGPMDLTCTEFTIRKVWVDNSDYDSRPESITLNLICDGTDTTTITLNKSDYDKDADEWTKTVYISPGLIVNGETLNAGHTYTIKEASTSNIYTLTADTYTPYLIDSSTDIYNGTTTASDDTSNLITELVATNTLTSYDLKLSKTDSSGNSLSGAQFTLTKVEDSQETDATDISGNTIGTITAGTGVEIGDLPTGTYKLTETKAPDGYTIVDPITFTVDRTKGTAGESDAVVITSDESDSASITQDGTNYLITVQDEKIYELPQTGGRGIYWNVIAGTLIAMFFAYAEMTMRRKRERRLKE